jgi:DNA-binding transcriptional LysR family regulator
MVKAAQSLAVSQPVVSKAISDLEHTTGVRLLDRGPYGRRNERKEDCRPDFVLRSN